ncbi:hypothetical protein CTA1_9653 [Colletotrichum tanaceti]|uniref:Uncharacterized protein n=1 Tax=Colletotrichum tanaceti TaxID=1306861 RepID=A0A4U6XDL2_9PEZI|nr:hypothetical protein CTA1_9653 [Colletotrichum tanaceti]
MLARLKEEEEEEEDGTNIEMGAWWLARWASGQAVGASSGLFCRH